MTLAIMQPYFFPYIGYFQLINAVDKFVVYDDVNFIKRGWVNRNRILVNGKDCYLTISIAEQSQNKLICESLINKNNKEILKNIRTLQMAYKKAPYFEKVFPILENILKMDCNLISELAYTSIVNVLKYLGINREIYISSEHFSNSKSLDKDKRVISICKELGATHYINAIGGQELYNKEDFAKEGIKLNFIKSKEIKYNQYKNEFVPWLSIIDVLMFNSQEEVRKMLDMYELV